MTSLPQSLRIDMNQGDDHSASDSDSESSEEEFPPEPEDLVEGSSASFVKRGPSTAPIAVVRNDKNKGKDKEKGKGKGKDKDKDKVAESRKERHTPIKPPPAKPDPKRYK